MACLCACERCGEARSECFCPEPEGPASDDCPLHGWQAPTESLSERGALDHYRPLGIR